MNPESILFNTYRTQTEEIAHELSLETQVTEALDVITADITIHSKVQAVRDNAYLKSELTMSLTPSFNDIAKAVKTEDNPVVRLSPAYESFDFSGVPFSSHIGKFDGAAGAAYTLFKIILRADDASNAPDRRGVYIARNGYDKSFIFFEIQGDGRRGTVRELVDDDSRNAIRDELQKAATRIKEQQEG